MVGRVYPSAVPHGAPQEFGEQAPRIGIVQIPLDSAQELKEVKITGTAMWAVEASSKSATMDVFVQDQFSGGFEVRQGFFVRGLPFSRLFVTHAAQGGEWIKLAYVREDNFETFEVINPSEAASTTQIETPDTVSTDADVTIGSASSGQVLASNGSRKEAFVQLLASAPGACRVGDSNVGASRGIEVQPGDTVVLTTTAEVQAHNPNGSGADFAVMEIEQS